MFGSSIEGTIIGTAVALWFAHGWYMNTKLEAVHRKLDHLIESFDGLREYLYEIDPQFDEERHSLGEALDGESPFGPMFHIDLEKRLKAEGMRTLRTPFFQR